MEQPLDHHLAQLNIGRIRYEVDDPRMADFTNNLALVNGLAERTPGFVWRYIDASGNSTSYQFVRLGKRRGARAVCLSNCPQTFLRASCGVV